MWQNSNPFMIKRVKLGIKGKSCNLIEAFRERAAFV